MEDDDRTLFIGNVDRNVSEEILYELFLQAGPIEKVNIPRGRNDYGYGFVTYKHECSVDYAINLFKGTTLFKKELSIKKRCSKHNANNQQSREFNKFDISDSGPGRKGFSDFQEQLHDLQLLAQNFNSMTNLPSNKSKGNWSIRNRPYDFKMKNHFSRSRDIRDRQKNRDHSSKTYHGRKNRHRE